METIDLNNCEIEPIETLGTIQPYGVLFFLDPLTLEILQASNNTQQWLGIEAQELLGQTLNLIFADAEVDFLKECLSQGNYSYHNPFLLTYKEQPFEGVIHLKESGVILEIELPSQTNDYPSANFYQILKPTIARLQTFSDHSLAELGQIIVQEIRKITQYDRVMLYQFEEDQSGVVIAEAKETYLESYLGLHYPATDIPQKARNLYYKNWLRMIGNVNAESIPIIPNSNPLTDAPLNLGSAILRSVSPIHIEYLQNMGVTATLAVSLINEEKLWGMIVCHHYSPKWVSRTIRQACEFLGQFISLEIFKQEQKELAIYQKEVDQLQKQIQNSIASEDKFIETLIHQNGKSLLKLLDAQGMAIILKGKITSFGNTPNQDFIEELLNWLINNNHQEIFATDCLSKQYTLATAYKSQASGLLAISIFLNQVSYHIMWFRPEIIQTVNWGGDPNKPVIKDDTGFRLSPRKSFELWKEIVYQKSQPWKKFELKAAQSFHNVLLLAVLEFSQKALELTAKKAEAASKAKSEFLANMSHEIRTPMNAILGFSDLLKELVTEDRCRAHVESIIASGRTLLDLINDILDLSKIEAGKLEIHPEPLIIRELIREIKNIFSHKVNENNIKLIVDVEASVPAMILFDAIRLRQILFNVVGNAIKFTEKGDIIIRLRSQQTSLDTNTIQLILSVEDTGIGISEEQQSSIFDAFQQADGQSTRKYGGSGLGLTITRRLTQMLGGIVELQSCVNQGSCFTFTFNNVPVMSSFIEPLNTLTEDNDLGQFVPATILVVDDVQANLDLVQAYFYSTQHHLLFAKDGLTAVELAEKHRPNLILLDWRMPNYDGEAVARHLKQNPSTENIPIIILTAFIFSVEKQNELKSLCQGFLNKPVKISQLVSVLKNILPNKTSSEQISIPPVSIVEQQEITLAFISPELIDKLRQEENNIYPQLCERMIYRDIKAFTQRLKQWAIDYECPPLSAYVTTLEQQMNEFDLQSLSDTIQAFPSIIQSLNR